MPEPLPAGMIMFEITLELSPIKAVYTREKVSYLVMGGLIVSVSLFIFYMVELLFEIVKRT